MQIVIFRVTIITSFICDYNEIIITFTKECNICNTFNKKDTDLHFSDMLKQVRLF